MRRRTSWQCSTYRQYVFKLIRHLNKRRWNTATSYFYSPTILLPITNPDSNKSSRFLGNLAFLVLLNLIVKPFWIFGIDLTVQNIVGNAAYGMYLTLFNFTFLFHILLDLGINNYNSRHIAQHPEQLAQSFPPILVLKMVLASFYFLICVSGAWWRGYTMYLFYFVALNQILIYFLLYFRSNLQGLHRFRQDSILSILDKLLMIVLVGTLLWGGITNRPFQIEWLVYAQTIAYFLTALIGFWWTKKQLPQLSWSMFKWDLALFKRILLQSYPFALLGFLISMYNKMDVVMIEAILGEDGDSQAGMYGRGYRLYEAVNMFALLFGTLLLPMFARLLQEKATKKVRDLVGFSSRLLFVLASIGALHCYCFRFSIMDWLYVDTTIYEAQIFAFLLLAFIPAAVSYVFGSLLTATNELFRLNLIAGLGVALNWGLNYWLIPQYAALGATYATFATQSLVVVLEIALTIRVISLKVSYSKMVLLLVFFALSIGIANYAPTLPFDWRINFLLGGIVSLFLAFLTDVFTWKEIKSQLK